MTDDAWESKRAKLCLSSTNNVWIPNENKTRRHSILFWCLPALRGARMSAPLSYRNIHLARLYTGESVYLTIV